MRPAIAALSVLIFTFIWNDYFWATVLTTSASDPAGDRRPLLAQRPVDRRTGIWSRPASIVAALPPVLMFFLMQKHFIAGLTLGAVK